MNKIIYPVSQLPAYQPGTNVSFYLSMENQRLVKGSLALSGKVTVSGLNAGTFMFTDNLIGAHAFFDGIAVETAITNFPVVNAYPRWIKSKRYCNWNKNSINLDKGAQMINVSGDFSYFNGQSFLIYPDIPINNSSDDLSYSKFGNIKISMNLTTALNAFFMSDGNSPDFNYSISDLKLHYKTLPDNMSKEIITFDTYSYNYTNIVSNNQIVTENISSMLVESMFGTFQVDGTSQVVTYNKAQFDDCGLQKVQFKFNDTQSYLNFALDTRGAIVLNSLAALNSNGMTSFTPTAEDVNVGTGPVSFGLKLPYPVNSSNSSITTNLSTTQVQPNNTYILHYYFVGKTAY